VSQGKLPAAGEASRAPVRMPQFVAAINVIAAKGTKNQARRLDGITIDETIADDAN
jgi:hypothetical protein